MIPCPPTFTCYISSFGIAGLLWLPLHTCAAPWRCLHVFTASDVPEISAVAVTFYFFEPQFGFHSSLNFCSVSMETCTVLTPNKRKAAVLQGHVPGTSIASRVLMVVMTREGSASGRSKRSGETAELPKMVNLWKIPVRRLLCLLPFHCEVQCWGFCKCEW